MSETLQELLMELEQFGQQNDAAISERPRRMLNITRDTGEFLSVLVQATNAQRVLEIGTSNGYSTLWLAQAVQRVGGQVTTVELSEFKLEMAARNFARSGLSKVITQHRGEAGSMLESLEDACFDLLFLDSKRSDYVHWWPTIQRVLRQGGLLVLITPLPMQMKWLILWRWYRQIPISPRALYLSAMASFWQRGAVVRGRLLSWLGITRMSGREHYVSCINKRCFGLAI